MPDDLPVQQRVERGDTGPVLVDVASRPGDLLVIGTGRRHPVGRALRRSVGRYCLAHATLPGARGAAVGADGRDAARPAVVALQAGRRPPCVRAYTAALRG